jgi:hypothetical protein
LFAAVHATGDESSAEFAALVDQTHARYVAALRQLFQDNKEKYAKVGQHNQVQRSSLGWLMAPVQHTAN